MRVFSPDRLFKRRTMFSSENFGLGDQNSRDLVHKWSLVHAPSAQALVSEIK